MAETDVPVELARILINERSPTQVIVLREKGGTREFPIEIGIFEAWAIDRKVKELDMPRPMTHDLLANVIGELGGRLERVVITAIEGTTFFARLIIQQDGKQLSVDCRPSDAVALAVRLSVPIFVNREIFEKASS